MTRKILEACPSCGGELEIGEVHCTNCETQIRAHYRPCDFCMLTEEQSTFLRLFVLSRGNLTEVEKRLGVSYPTVRAKLDEVIERLGSPGAGSPNSPPSGSSGSKRRPAGEPMPEPEVPEAVGRPGGPPPAPVPSASGQSERRQILQAVERGEITAVEGTARIRALERGEAGSSGVSPENSPS